MRIELITRTKISPRGSSRFDLVDDQVVDVRKSRRHDRREAIGIFTDDIDCRRDASFARRREQPGSLRAELLIGVVHTIEEEQVTERQDLAVELIERIVLRTEKRVCAAVVKEGATAALPHVHHVGVSRRHTFDRTQVCRVDTARPAVFENSLPVRVIPDQTQRHQLVDDPEAREIDDDVVRRTARPELLLEDVRERLFLRPDVDRLDVVDDPIAGAADAVSFSSGSHRGKISAGKSARSSILERSFETHSAEPATNAAKSCFGPWMPTVSVFSMSAVRLGPVIHVK